MACFWLHQEETSVNIDEVEEISAVTYYKIQVTVANVQWTVLHRYNDFYELHNALVSDHGVAKDSLPPKKVIRNKCPIFIETRRKALELYLKNCVNYLNRTMPRIFVEFLEFHVYDIFFMLQNLAFKLYFEADAVLCSTKMYTFSPLQLHGISECFKKPFPEVEQNDKRYDLSHVMDFCSQLHHLCVLGSAEQYASSNIIPNNLHFEFSSFKSLQILEIVGVGLENVYSVDNLRHFLLKLCVHKTSIKNISQILQCDVLHKTVVENCQVWSTVTEMDFSNNNITEIDDSINLVPNVKRLLLNHNKISSISNLSSLSQLTYLSISDNLISSCDDLHTKLGNVVYLDLSQNNITSLRGISKLYSLESLDINSNKISDVEEVACIGDLPCLENVVLTGNSVSTTVDYRVKVFENFADRAKEICLDNEKPSQAELDKVSILRALRIVKEGKTPTFNNSLNTSFI